MAAPSVRPAAPADLPELGRMLHDFNREFDEPAPEPAWLTARVSTLLQAGDTIVLVADDEAAGVPCGLALLRVRPGLWSAANEAYLAELYVRPAHRGGGLGRALLEAARAAAAARGCDHISLTVDEPDTAARRLYASAGFVADTARPDGPPSFYLELGLEPPRHEGR